MIPKSTLSTDEDETIGEEKGALRSDWGCVDQIFTSEKMREENIVIGFYGFATSVWKN